MHCMGGVTMDYYEIGQRIRKIRKAQDIAQEELAEKAGISTTHMSHIETGNTKLSLPVLVSLASALRVRTDDLLFGHFEGDIGNLTKETAEILNVCTEKQAHFLNDLLRSAWEAMKKDLD